MMNEPKIYIPKKWWRERGAKPNGLVKRDPEHTKFIQDYVKKLKPESILEVGCGDGRITKKLLKIDSLKKYVGLDLSEDRIFMHKNNVKDEDYGKINHELKNMEIQDLDESDKYDLVISFETMLHVRPEDIAKAIKKQIKASKKHVINVDLYYSDKKFKYPDLEYYNFEHDYPKIYNEFEGHLEIVKIDNFQHAFIFTK